jgi:hypothetical protein
MDKVDRQVSIEHCRRARGRGQEVAFTCKSACPERWTYRATPAEITTSVIVINVSFFALSSLTSLG